MPTDVELSGPIEPGVPPPTRRPTSHDFDSGGCSAAGCRTRTHIVSRSAVTPVEAIRQTGRPDIICECGVAVAARHAIRYTARPIAMNRFGAIRGRNARMVGQPVFHSDLILRFHITVIPASVCTAVEAAVVAITPPAVRHQTVIEPWDWRKNSQNLEIDLPIPNVNLECPAHQW